MISVLIPTYKRLACLKRVMSQVLSQTYTEWELVISDDEVGEECETWQWLQQIAREDQRIRPIKNFGPKHGQVYNVNNGLCATRGEWVKVLFDDDGILPNCLERFAEVAEMFPKASLIGCRAQTWRKGVHTGDEPNYQRAPIEVIRREDALLSLCLLDRFNGTTPSHVLVRGDLVRSGFGMVDDDKFKMAVDVRWFSRLFSQGDHVVISDVLIQQRQGEVESLTSKCWSDADILDKEDLLVYEEIFNLAERDAHWPTLRQMTSMIGWIKFLFHLCGRRPKNALRMLLIGLRSWKGSPLAARFFLQKLYPDRFTATRRYSLEA